MSSLRLLSAVEQVAEHLREEILRGRWSGTLPGVYLLASELSVNHKTVGSAIRQLEREGLLEGQGAGRNRRIVLPAGRKAVRSMRVGFSYNNTIEDRKTDFIIVLRHALAEAGHLVVSPRNSLLELKMDV